MNDGPVCELLTDYTARLSIKRRFKMLDPTVVPLKNMEGTTWWQKAKAIIGPGFVVAIAYLDPGNMQADIQAGSSSGYTLIWTIMWATLLSLYIQMMCIRLAIYKHTDLAMALGEILPAPLRIMCWVIAEYTAIITDIPEVIGMGIAFNIFFGWPYSVGILLSFVSTMLFLLSQSFRVRTIEALAAFLMLLLAIVMFIEWGSVNTDTTELFKGWIYGFVDVNADLAYTILGIIGCVVMPHNLYLHTGCLRTRSSPSNIVTQKEVVRLNLLEMILPLALSFAANMAVVVIAAENVYGTKYAEDAGIINFSDYLTKLPFGPILWGLVLLASAQSSCVTTTYAGQFIMDGFMHMNLPISLRAVITRSITIIPCIMVSVFVNENGLTFIVNFVNSSLAILLPFALTPLVKLVSSPKYMGEAGAPAPWHSMVMYCVAGAVYLVNAVVLILPGAGFLGDFIYSDATHTSGGLRIFYGFLAVLLEIIYLAWNLWIAFIPLPDCVPTQRESKTTKLPSTLPCQEDETTIEVTDA